MAGLATPGRLADVTGAVQVAKAAVSSAQFDAIAELRHDATASASKNFAVDPSSYPGTNGKAGGKHPDGNATGNSPFLSLAAASR